MFEENFSPGGGSPRTVIIERDKAWHCYGLDCKKNSSQYCDVSFIIILQSHLNKCVKIQWVSNTHFLKELNLEEIYRGGWI